MNRRRLILFVLLVVFALSAVYSYIRMPRQQTVAQLKKAPGAPSQRQGKTMPAAPRDEKKVHLDLLGCPQPRFAGFRTNIFRPIFHEEAKLVPAPPALPKPVPLPPPPPMPMPSVAPQPVPVSTPPPVVRDMARFTFMGFLKKDNQKTIFLTKDKEIILVRKGDKIGGTYEVTNVTDEALSIRVLSDGSEIVIPLVDQKPLSAQMR
jgi:hypothetical protein